MNWNAVIAIAELLGASGVIATLFYLAVQVKQNTKSVCRHYQNAYHQFRDGVLSERQWQDISAPIPRLLGNAGGREMWAVVRSSFGDDFQEMVEAAAAPANPGAENAAAG